MSLQQLAFSAMCVKPMENTFNEVWLQGITDDQSNQPSTASARDVSGDRPKRIREAVVEHIKSINHK